MRTRSSHALFVSLLILTVVSAGCAKRPATTQAVAPAPTGTAVTTRPAVPSPPATADPSRPADRPTTAAPSQPGVTGVPGAPGTPGAPGVQPPTGAPATPGVGARPSPKEFVSVPDLRDVFFDFDRYDIRPEDAKTLEANAAWLKANPHQLVLIEGHCDERGTNEYNLALGERRAKAAMNYLVSQGVQANRITIISYGEERPMCIDKTEGCWAKNRRAHFLVKPR
jgi:peptidoglycan-associated lipoprotein